MYVDGRKVRKYATSERAAKELLAQMRDEPPTVIPHTARVTVVEYVTAWLNVSLPHQGLAPRTVTMYRSTGNYAVLPALDDKTKLAEFTASDVEAWIRRLNTIRKRPHTPKATKANPNPKPIPGALLSPNTRRIAYNVLAKALDTAVRDGLIKVNPVRQVPRPKPSRPAVPVVQPDQAELALAKADELDARIAPMLWFVTWTGVRVGEALALRWDDVDFDRATATIRAGSVGSDTTKTGKVRSVTMIPEVVDKLRAWRTRQRQERLMLGPGWTDTGLVFTTITGAATDEHNARRDLKAVLRNAGLPQERPWHALRHGLAHRLLRQGLPAEVVSAMLGHSSIRVTVDIYGHVNPAVDQDVLVKALGR